ncbi:HAD-superfamily subfamily IB hydrolase, TIGR01490 [Clostridium sp. USBA 49]|jgi:HAD superfamily hydrolase (TIGR01490 family)|uniref:HAD-IB family hydrolase n=1 Tax=Clostridium TaxID=1485 RepID=UPI000999B8E6|nr:MULTISPECIES: HAD-IB family hydrolase [Clostridium]SKA75042.1 HAD-superfamily subfamily IB hydrolase, TIGR01490 [Clostridium sp. USBA 49]
MNKNIGAFFDIDGTLYREGLIAEIFKKLVKYEIIEEKRWYNEVRPEYQKYDKRQGNYDNYLLKMADIYIEAIKGLHKSQVEFIAKNVVKQKGDRVYTFTRDRIKWHKEQGHMLITISGSPIELVKEMALKYGFDDYKGALYKLDENNMYTGEVVPMWDSRSKKKAIMEFMDKYNIDLEKSYAYGDTAGDFSMFELVGFPICVNPTKELVKKVKEHEEISKKAIIVVERKDMIYKLTPDLIQF